MFNSVSLDNSAAIGASYRFFVTATFFSLAFSVCLLCCADNIFHSHLHPRVVVATHLLTLGVIVMIMFGAWFQILPVVTSVQLPRHNLTSLIVYLNYTVAILIFINAYLFQLPGLTIAAATWLFILFFVFAILVTRAFLKNRVYTHTAMALALSVWSLVLALTLILLNLIGTESSFLLNRFAVLKAHLGLTLGGWVFLSIAGVSFQVVPMFYVTEVYPPWFTRLLAPVIFVLLAAYATTAIFFDLPWFMVFMTVILALMLATWASITIYLLGARKRKRYDPVVYFWYTGAAFLIVLSGYIVYSTFAKTILFGSSRGFAVGTGYLFFFVLMVIKAMLHKIIPFLSWYHLFQAGMMQAPSMHQFMPKVYILIDYLVFLVASVFIALAMFIPGMQKLAGVVVMLSFIIMTILTLLPVRRYYILKKKLSA